jgi:AraC-like DNA-binding protein
MMYMATASRAAEIQKIVHNCLKRLEVVLGENNGRLFKKSLTAAGISSQALETGAGLSLARLDQVLYYLRKDLPGITLELFSALSLMDLGLVGYAAASADTAGYALKIVNSYHELTSDRFRPVMAVEGEWAHVIPVIASTFSNEFRDIAEDHLAGTWNLLRQLLGYQAVAESIEIRLAYGAPAYEALYDQVFGVKALFNAQRTELIFPSAWLNLPVVTANPEIAELSSSVCERLLGPASRETDTVSSVRTLLLSRPGTTMLGVEAAAKALNLSAEQLRKRLWRQGSSYKSLVLEVRMMLGMNYLSATSLSVQEIAYLLGYSQPGAFSRAFKKHYGLAPLRCREQSKPNMPEPG